MEAGMEAESSVETDNTLDSAKEENQQTTTTVNSNNWLTLRRLNQDTQKAVERNLRAVTKLDPRSFLGTSNVSFWRERKASAKVAKWIAKVAPEIEYLGKGSFLPESLVGFRCLREVELKLLAEEVSVVDIEHWKGLLRGLGHRLESLSISGYVTTSFVAGEIVGSVRNDCLRNLDLSKLLAMGEATTNSWIQSSLYAPERLKSFGFPPEVVMTDFLSLLEKTVNLEHLTIPIRCTGVSVTLVPSVWSNAILKLANLKSIRIPKASRLNAPFLLGLIQETKTLDKLSFPLRGGNVPGVWPLLKEIRLSPTIRDLELTDPIWDGIYPSRQLLEEVRRMNNIQSLLIENRSLIQFHKPPSLSHLTFAINRTKGHFEFKVDVHLESLSLEAMREFRGRIIVGCGVGLTSSLRKLRVAGRKECWVDLVQGLILGCNALTTLDLSDYRCDYESYRRLRDGLKLPRLKTFIPPAYYS